MVLVRCGLGASQKGLFELYIVSRLSRMDHRGHLTCAERLDPRDNIFGHS